jgi:hypothetical protein
MAIAFIGLARLAIYNAAIFAQFIISLIYMRLLRLSLLTLCLLASLPAVALQEGTPSYAYSVFVGTGRYTIGDRSIYVLRAPASFTLKQPDYETKQIGYRLLAPIAVGLTDFDEFSEIPDLEIDDIQSVSFVPGVEVFIPVTQNWRISPYGQAGLGWDMKSSDNSIVWGVGARTRAWFGDNQRWLIGGEALRAGNNPQQANEPSSAFTRFALGTEYKWQTNWAPFGYRVSWHARLIEWIYSEPAVFVPPQEETRLNSSTEIGLSFGISPSINLLGYKFRQLGVGYERSDELRAIKIYTVFPF